MSSRRSNLEILSRNSRLAVALVVAVLLGVQIVSPSESSIGRHLSAAGMVALSVLGLYALEQLYRNSHATKKWALKFFFIGVGMLMIFDLYLYSETLLFGGLDGSVWSARGLIYVLAVPLLAIAVKRNPELAIDLFVSRRMVYYSASLVGVGLYLATTVLGGYYIQRYGGSWGTAGQVIFLFGAGMVLAILMFSGSLRAKTRVFVGKHFYRTKYDYREIWLKFSKSLSQQVSDRSDSVWTCHCRCCRYGFQPCRCFVGLG